MTVTPGALFSVEVALPIALTPPPGVQKAVVWKNWHVFVERRADIAFGKTSKVQRFELRLLRIRPNSQNRNYQIFVEALYWQPDGEYDLVISGPGFSYASPKSILVQDKGDKSVKQEFTGAVVQTEPDEWRITVGDKSMTALDVVMGPETGGVRVMINGKRTADFRIFWASHRVKGKADNRRMLRIRVPSESEEGDVFVLALKSAKKVAGRRVRIEGMGSGMRPLEWTSLRASASFKPVQWIWRFVDGDSRVGEKVTYRWMVGTDAIAQVTAFDEYGIPVSAELTYPLRMPLSRGDGMCALAPGKRPGMHLLKFLLQIWVESFSILME